MTTPIEQGVALQAAVDRLLASVDACGPVGREVMIDAFDRGKALMLESGEEGLLAASVWDSFQAVVRAVQQLKGDDDNG